MRRCTLTLVCFFASGSMAVAAPLPADRVPDLKSFLRTDWTTANGLPQSTVSAILQTRDGYLWLATFGGLVRFDGVTFTVFTAANTRALKSNRILSLHEDPGGTLWIGTELGGAARMANGAFLAPVTTSEGLPGNSVYGVTDALEGVWLATLMGIARVRDGRVVEKYSSANGLVSDETSSVLADPGGGLWVGNTAGLQHLKNGVVTRVPAGDLRDPRIRSIHRAPDGSLWVGTYAGLARLQGSVLASTPGSTGHVRSIASGANGELWAASSSGVISVRDNTASLLLAGIHLRAVALDREGSLWIGGDASGLSRLRLRPVTSFTRQDGLAGRSVLPILSDRRGRVWVGGMCGGLSWFEDGKWTIYSQADGLPGSCVQALAEDRAGTLWVGTTSGLFRWEGGRFVRWSEAAGLSRGVAVRAIHQDRADALWVGSSAGLSRLDGERPTLFSTREGLVNDDVRFLTEDREGALWIGTVGGASRLAGGRFTNYTTANGLAHDFVRAIYEDHDGAIWMGTYGGGLHRLRHGRLAVITTRNGLFDDVVSAILEDGSGSFWMSGNRGVFRISRRELNDVADGKAETVTSVAYGVADGMVSSETNGGGQPAACKTPDGRLWFPTIEGVAVFDPERRTNALPPPVVIEQVSIDATPIKGTSAPLDVPAGTRSLEFRYTGLSLAAPERMRFRYTLDGYDKGWNDAGTRRAAYYTSLPPGRYRFRVIASNNDGVWNESGASLELRQHPRFYQTPPFYLLLAMTTAAAAGAGHRIRLRQLLRRTRELERHVAARTAEVVERSSQLAQANERLSGANTAIAAARDDMLATLNQLRLGVALVEKTGEVAFLNRQARDLLDIDPEVPARRPWDDLLPLAERDRAQLRATALLPQARRTRLPVRVETASRRSYWMELEVHDDPRDPERRIFCLYDLSEVYDLRRLLDDKAQFHGLVGQSAAMQLVVKQIRDVAGVDTTVLIEGQTGTGKELVARAIHYSSARKMRAFVPVNCAGLSESILASQLFGHRRGAFTGAVADQIGLFESGEGGTVFLDEIGDVPPPIQNSLLRVLQEKEITRVGENRPHKIDVRIVAATHRDLAQLVAEGRFREDLLYRIRVARIQVPPLRERRADIPLLAAWFLGQARAASRRDNLEVSHEAMDLLIDCAWPGNVRELKSAIDSAAIRATGTLIQPNDLPPEVLAQGAGLADAVPASSGSRQEILDALGRADGNRAAAARLLGIGRSTLYRRMRALGIEDDPA